MKSVRRLHLYLGCFFAPLLLFYVVTGVYQTFNPHRNKGLGEADTWISRLRSVHVDQVYPAASANSYSTKSFRVLVAVMGAALVLTVLLGIVLAFRSLRQKWLVTVSLLLGVLVPVIALWLGQRR
jgi:multidrug efflux pump subunit AcrB